MSTRNSLIRKLQVGETYTSAAAIRSASSGSTAPMPSGVWNEQCSRVSTPASSARRMPSVPCAWAATNLFSRCASSTATRSSSVVNWACQGAEPGVMFPPVDISLMTSTPALWWRRTIWRISATLSTSAPMNQQCPPVTVMAGPAVSIRGPRVVPSAMASRTAMSR